MIDLNSVKNKAESEIRDEQMEKATEKIKTLLRKEILATQILNNIKREIADAYAELGQGTSSQPTD